MEYAIPNYIFELFDIPNDPHFPELRGLHNTGQNINGINGTSGIDIGRIPTIDVFSGRSDTTGSIVAVIDNGVNYHHPDLTGQMRTPTANCKRGVTSQIEGICEH